MKYHLDRGQGWAREQSPTHMGDRGKGRDSIKLRISLFAGPEQAVLSDEWFCS